MIHSTLIKSPTCKDWLSMRLTTSSKRRKAGTRMLAAPSPGCDARERHHRYRPYNWTLQCLSQWKKTPKLDHFTRTNCLRPSLRQLRLIVKLKNHRSLHLYSFRILCHLSPYHTQNTTLQDLRALSNHPITSRYSHLIESADTYDNVNQSQLHCLTQ
jgi:hypothetical protein